MNVYAVIATTQSSVEPIRQKVESVFAENYFRAGDMCWMVADSQDIRGVSRKLGIGEPGNQPSVPLGNVIVIWAVSYWGRGEPNLWAWMAQKIQQVSIAPSPPPIEIAK